MITLGKGWNCRLCVCIILSILMAGSALAETEDASRISAAQGAEKVSHGAILVDVRAPEEFAAGHVEGALNIAHGEIENHLAELGSDKEREIVLYCGSGRRAAIAQQTLKAHGYRKVFNSGGYEAWINVPGLMPK